MDVIRARQLVKKLVELQFPYEDCASIQAKEPDETDSLIENLHVYLQRIKSFRYIFWRTRDWTDEEMRMFHGWVKEGFLDTYSYSENVRRLISREKTPDLHALLATIDEIRPLISSRLLEIDADRQNTSSNPG